LLVSFTNNPEIIHNKIGISMYKEILIFLVIYAFYHLWLDKTPFKEVQFYLIRCAFFANFQTVFYLRELARVDSQFFQF
jgi:hypothetical protein